MSDEPKPATDEEIDKARRWFEHAKEDARTSGSMDGILALMGLQLIARIRADAVKLTKLKAVVEAAKEVIAAYPGSPCSGRMATAIGKLNDELEGGGT